MTVTELRAALDALPPEAAGWTVVLSRDSEGNGFSPLRDCIIGLYEPENGAPAQGTFVAEADPGTQDVFWCADALALWPVR